MVEGIANKILRVNLSNGSITIDEQDEGFYRMYLGGAGLAAYYLLKETEAGVDALSPENKLIFGIGPVTGTPMPGGSRASIGTKSPLTGGIAKSEVGGYFGYELKRAGYDSLIVEGKADAVFGSRFLGGGGRVLYFWHSVGNRFLTLLSNMMTDLNLTDMETCYKMVRAPLMKSLVLTSDRFGFEPEVTARLAQAKARIWEMPITYSGRTYEEGKKVGWKDGAAALVHIIHFNLFPPRRR